nr:MAG TPA: minor tail protein [Caudoviricetes sp.]
MEYVTLKVKVDSADAKLNIQSVRKAVTELQTVSSKPITISVKATGLDTNIGGELERNLGQLDATAVKTGDTFTSLYAKIAKWGIMTSVVYGPIKAFREALNTLKAVDTEMVNVQKVTDYSKEQMEELEENAYALASAYGRTADEITAMYTTFARAGFLGDQLDSMTELGTLLANIGDISQDTASKFLLAVDAAWKLNGSESELMTVMDGLNEITNKNAVDMEALTSGITVAGSVFAEAGESAQTFSALVGAGVAATQRSGSEISRGLRTIVMNIRQIKGETEDGELIDGESIAKASKALREYAGISTMANGQLRLSSEVLKDLAEKWNSLDTVAQSAIAEALAGKRQANILTALMGNWNTVEKMMQDYADGAGSALKENEIYLDSWEAKSKQLTASWTEFVSHLVETDTIKDALDGVIGLVEFLDSDTGRLVVKVAALTAGVVALGNATKAALASEALKKFLSADIWKNLAQWFSWVSSGALSAGQSVSALGQVLSQSLGGMLPKLGIGAAIFAALAVAISLSTEKARAYEKSLEDVKAAQSALDETKSEYDELINKTEELTDAEKRRLEVLQATREEQEKQLEAAKKKAWEDWNAIHGTGATVIVDGMDANTGGMAVGAAKAERMDIVALRNYREELAQIEEQYRAGEMSAGEYYTALEKLNAAREESVETIRAAIAAGYDVTEEQKALVAAYDNTSIILGKVTGITYEWIASLIEEARAAGTAEDALYDTVSAAKILSNTKLDLNQQIQALAMLRFQLEQTAIQAAYTAKEISLVGLLTGTVGNIISSTVSSVLDGAGSAGQESGISAAAGSSSGGSSDAAERKRAQAAIKELEKQRDAEIEPLEDQIDALKKQNEEIERGEKLEELKLDVLKKQDALLNARNERTVRQYNAATGQWEWVADANKVKDAEEDLENAKKDLRDYEREVELDLAVAELEARIEAIKAAYQIKIDAWQDYLDGLDGAVAAEGEYLNTSVKQNKDAAEAIADAWEEAAERKRKAQAAISAAAGAAADVPSSTNPSTSAAVSGAVGGAANSPSSTKPSASGAVAGAVGGAAKPKPSGGGGVNKVARYDSGGVLKGLGGIKATVDDEMVLPPDITEKMLRPSANGVFRQRMGELGYLYGVERPAAQNMAGKSDNRSYTDHSGPEYHYGSITLTKEQAETTTVAELRRMAHHLQPYGG